MRPSMAGSDPNITCPECGSETGGSAFCPKCGHVSSQPLKNGSPAGANVDATIVLQGVDRTLILPSQQIGRFRLAETIGSGGFATVYRAEDTQLGRDVALKILHAYLTENADFVRRFSQETRAMARLRHRNVVQIYDAAETPDGRPYLVMELLQGTLLSQIIAERAPLPLSEAISIV